MKNRLKRYFINIWETLRRADMTVLPGQLAFFFILALVPTITVLFYMAHFLNISLSDITVYLDISLSPAITELITPVIEIENNSNVGLIVLLIVSIYISSNATNSIIICANNIYGIEQDSYFKRRGKAIIMVLILILLFLFIWLVPIFGNFLLSLIEKITGYSEIYDLLHIFKTPFSLFVIFIFIKMLYTIAPNKRIPSSHVNIGAIFTSIGWVVATEAYLYYASHFAHYTLYYSGLSNIAILMIWVYILAIIFVIGMSLNYKEEPYEMEKTTRIKKEKLAKKTMHKNRKNTQE